jgi:nucleoside-diphosphate-sugar epimerase
MTDKKKIVVLAGATGALGSDIAQALLEKPNVQLRLLVRPESVGKLATLKEKGAEIVEIDLQQEGNDQQLVDGLNGAFSLISALNGGREIIVDTQAKMLNAARAAHVRRFIPSDFSYNIFGLDEGDNPNSDDRRAFAKVADAGRGDVEVVHILNGAFLDKRIVFGFLGAFDLQQQQALLWGDGDAVTDVTTYRDTGRYAAEVAVDDAQVPAVFEVAGEVLTFNQLVKAYEEASGKSLTVVNKGSYADLDREIEARLKAEPGNFYAWLPLMYYRGSFGGKGKLHAIANDRYPSVKPETVQDYVRREKL